MSHNDETQARHEAWLRSALGPNVEPAIAKGRAIWSAMSDDDRRAHLAELEEIEGSLASAMRSGVDPTDCSIDPLIERHRAWVGVSWNEMPAPGAYAGLADLYEAHPDFAARYEAIEPGFTEFLAAAMRSRVNS